MGPSGAGTPRNAYYFQMLKSLAGHYGFDIDQSYEELDEDIRHMVLYGSDDEVITFTYLSDRAGTYSRSHPFEGVITNMQRRFRRPSRMWCARSCRNSW